MAFDQAAFISFLTEISKLAYKLRFEVPQQALGVGSVIQIIEDIQNAADGTYKTDQIQAAESARSAYANFVVSTQAAATGAGAANNQQNFLLALYSQLFQATLIDILNRPRDQANNPFNYFVDITEWMIAQGLYVDTRAVVFDTVATESGTGTGTVTRLTVDQFGQPLEQAKAPLNITFACVLDASSPNIQLGQEQFNIEYPGALDALDAFTGKTTVSSVSISGFNSDTGNYLSNCASWGSAGPNANPTNLGLWVDTQATPDYSPYSITADGRFRSIEQVQNNQEALALTVSTTARSIRQSFRNLSPSNPIHMKMEVFVPAGTTSAAITIDFGSQSQVFSISGGELVANQWNTIEVTPDQMIYPYQFSDGLDTSCEITFEFDGANIRISNFQVTDFTFFLGSYWSVTPGETAFLANPSSSQKTFLFEDTAGLVTAAKIQASFAAVAGRSFPVTGTTLIPNF